MTRWNGSGRSVVVTLKVNARDRWGCAPSFTRRFCELGSSPDEHAYIAQLMAQAGNDRESA